MRKYLGVGMTLLAVSLFASWRASGHTAAFGTALSNAEAVQIWGGAACDPCQRYPNGACNYQNIINCGYDSGQCSSSCNIICNPVVNYTYGGTSSMCTIGFVPTCGYVYPQACDLTGPSTCACQAGGTPFSCLVEPYQLINCAG